MRESFEIDLKKLMQDMSRIQNKDASVTAKLLFDSCCIFALGAIGVESPTKGP